MNFKLVYILIFSLMLMFVGCSIQKTNEKDSLNIIDPSQLISLDEATEIMGIPLNDSEKTEMKVVGLKTCMYIDSKTDSDRFLQIALTQLNFIANQSSQTPKMMYESIKGNFDNHIKIFDIGDDAFIAPPGLHIIKGEYYITIGIGNSDKESNHLLLKKSGEKAIENLENLIK